MKTILSESLGDRVSFLVAPFQADSQLQQLYNSNTVSATLLCHESLEGTIFKKLLLSNFFSLYFGAGSVVFSNDSDILCSLITPAGEFNLFFDTTNIEISGWPSSAVLQRSHWVRPTTKTKLCLKFGEFTRFLDLCHKSQFTGGIDDSSLFIDSGVESV